MSAASQERYFLWELSQPDRPALIGELRKLSNGDVSLQYEASWINSGYALSADMPLVDREYTPVHRRMRERAAPGAVDDARPDHWGERVIRYLHKPRGNHLIDYLYLTGDDRFGALGISSSGTRYQPFPTPALPRLEDAPQMTAHEFLIGEDSPEPLLEHCMAVCAQFELTPSEARLEIRRIIDVVEQWQAYFLASGVSKKDVDEIASFIDGDELMRERRKF